MNANESRAALAQKRAAVDALIQQVERDLAMITSSQKQTVSGAVHEESRAEDPKDTRATETAYLARGLAKRVAELRTTLNALVATELRPFPKEAPATLSAWVTVEDDEGASLDYLLLPEGGGRRAVVDGLEFIAVTPRSPLGKALLGKRIDDDVRIQTPGGLKEALITGVR